MDLPCQIGRGYLHPFYPLCPALLHSLPIAARLHWLQHIFIISSAPWTLQQGLSAFQFQHKGFASAALRCFCLLGIKVMPSCLWNTFPGSIIKSYTLMPGPNNHIVAYWRVSERLHKYDKSVFISPPSRHHAQYHLHRCSAPIHAPLYHRSLSYRVCTRVVQGQLFDSQCSPREYVNLIGNDSSPCTSTSAQLNLECIGYVWRL